jgi:hypothetical protein
MRRTTRVGLLVLAAVVVGFFVGSAYSNQDKPPKKPDNSPHAEALALVLKTQMDDIRKVEGPKRFDGGDGSWWFDALERTWVVKRPAEPGVNDTTHMFIVTYKIDGKDAAVWLVDTRKGTATRGEIKK